MEQNNLTILQLQLRFFNADAYKHILFLTIFTSSLCQQNILDQAIKVLYKSCIASNCPLLCLAPAPLRLESDQRSLIHMSQLIWPIAFGRHAQALKPAFLNEQRHSLGLINRKLLS